MKKLKVSDLAICAVFLLIIFGFAIAYFIVPDSAVSEVERRSDLQLFPEPEEGESYADYVLSGSFNSDFADYLADQMPARTYMTGFKALFERILLKRENNGVVLAENGVLAERFDGYDEDSDSYSLTGYDKKGVTDNLLFLSYLESIYGVDAYAAIAPRKIDVMGDELPPLFPTGYAEQAFSLIEETCEKNGVSHIDLYSPLLKAAAEGENVFYKTDHHWTSYGAYLAYREICAELEITPREISDFDVTALCDDFYGTTYSKAGLLWFTQKETIELYTLRDGNPVKTKIVNYGDERDAEINGFIYPEYLDGFDKHEAFVGGNNPRTDLYTDESGRETIIIIKDSFAHSLAPFLALHYDVILIDARLYPSYLGDLIKEHNVSKIILCENLDTLSSQKISLWA